MKLGNNTVTMNKNGALSSLRNVFSGNILILLIAYVVTIFVLSLMSPHFLKASYLLSVTRYVGEKGIMALGMTIVILTGGIDLSVGAMLALSGVLFGMMLSAGVPPVIAVISVLLIGILGGLLNGVLVSKFKIPALIATLATQYVFNGFALGLSGGNAFNIDKSLTWMGKSSIIGLPFQLVMMIILYVIFGFVMRRTNMGLNLVSIGSNEESSIFSGVHVGFEVVRAYALSGFLSALVGIMFACRLASAKCDVGGGYELDCITIAAFGGASLAGGKVSILGSFIAAFVIVTIRLGLSLAGVLPDAQTIVVGAVLIAAVGTRTLVALKKKPRL